MTDAALPFEPLTGSADMRAGHGQMEGLSRTGLRAMASGAQARRGARRTSHPPWPGGSRHDPIVTALKNHYIVRSWWLREPRNGPAKPIRRRSNAGRVEPLMANVTRLPFAGYVQVLG